MTFKEVIKDSILEGFTTDITTTKICVTLGLSLIIGLYIYTIYKYKSKSSFYSKDFNNVLAVLPVITSGIVLAMQSSIVISLGMVGALSIVRFRNAVKSSLDLTFLFWSISIGIIIGAGIYEIGVILSFIITLLLIGLDFIPLKKQSFLLAINSSDLKIMKEITPILNSTTHTFIVKSKSQHDNQIELIIELKIKKDKENELFILCNKIKSIKCINLLSHDGETKF